MYNKSGIETGYYLALSVCFYLCITLIWYGVPWCHLSVQKCFLKHFKAQLNDSLTAKWLVSGPFLKRQSPAPDKTLAHQVGHSAKVLKLWVGVWWVWSVPFSLWDGGFLVQAVHWTGSNMQKPDRRKKSCLHKDRMLNLFHKLMGEKKKKIWK